MCNCCLKIQNNVSIYEGVELENYVFCGPSVVFTNINRPRSEFPQRGSDFYEKTLVKESVTLGANCTILCGVTIGEYAFVGAGAVVTKDVAPHSLMTGNPAKKVCWVGFMGERLSFDKDGISNCNKFKQKDGSDDAEPGAGMIIPGPVSPTTTSPGPTTAGDDGDSGFFLLFWGFKNAKRLLSCSILLSTN